MWNNLPHDLLTNIFSLLSPDSLACARSVCRQWCTYSKTHPLSSLLPRDHHPSWFLAMPKRSRKLIAYLHNPFLNRWHKLSVDFLSYPVRPIASIEGLLLLRPTNSTDLHFILCNPFAREFKPLPLLNIRRTNPAVGIAVESDPSHNHSCPNFRLFVVGGMSDAASGGAIYEPLLEVYDSRHGKWQIVGKVPMEFAVRLTVWTPNETAYCSGVLYWMTSARAYSIMGFDIRSNTWRELKVPVADRIEFAALVKRSNGKLTLVGGISDTKDACIWELDEQDDSWRLIEELPMDLALRLLGGKGSWHAIKCVGTDEAICLYRDLVSGMIVWTEVAEKGRWEWLWVDGCCSIRGEKVQNCVIKGLLLHPNLSPCILNSLRLPYQPSDI